MINMQSYEYIKDKVIKFDFMVSAMESGWCPDIVEKNKNELKSIWIGDNNLLEFLWKHKESHSKMKDDCKLCYYFKPYSFWESKQSS